MARYTHRLPGPLVAGIGPNTVTRSDWKDEIKAAMEAWSEAIKDIWEGVTVDWEAAIHSVEGSNGDEHPNEVETETIYTLPHDKGLGDFRFGQHEMRSPGGGVPLAHQMFPRGILEAEGQWGGDGHFNLDNFIWRTADMPGPEDPDDETRFNIQRVAAHEIGHGLGLPHSSQVSALMYPFVGPTQNFEGIPELDKACFKELYESEDGELVGNCNLQEVSPEQGGRWQKLVDAVKNWNDEDAVTQVRIRYSFIAEEQEPGEHTIQRIGIGSEHGNECCLCCGLPHVSSSEHGTPCYTGCCPCKPSKDLTVTATQWYVQTPGTPAAWTAIDPPCIFTFDLTQRMYECMGSGAQEFDYIRTDIYPRTPDSCIDSVDFLKTYGWPPEGASNYGPGPFGPDLECPRDEVDAQNRAYNESFDCHPMGGGGAIGVGNFRRLTTCMHPDGPYLGNSNSTDDPDLDADHLKIPSERESWGFTGKICKKIPNDAASHNSDGECTNAVGESDRVTSDLKGSFSNPAHKYRESDCGGMCITAQLCCCRGLESPLTKPCATDRKGPHDGSNNYECQTECYKFGIQAYNCYHYSGSVDKAGAQRTPDCRMNWGDDGPFDGEKIVDGGVEYGPFPMIDREDIEYYLDCENPGLPPGPMTEGGRYLNTPCSPCTYLERGTYFPQPLAGGYECNDPDPVYHWDGDPDCRNKIDEWSNKWCDFAWAGEAGRDDQCGCYGWAGLPHTLPPYSDPPNYCTFFEGAADGGDPTMVDKQDTVSISSRCNAGTYFPNYGSQCACPTCDPEKKLILKYTIYMQSTCDCTASRMRVSFPIDGHRAHVIPDTYKIDLTITEKEDV